MTDQEQIAVKMARAEALAAEATRLQDERRPRVLRLLSARRAWHLLEQAQTLLNEVNVLMGETPTYSNQVRLGMGYIGWRRVQWGVGILNAFTAIMAFSEHHWLTGAISSLCVLGTADWILPMRPFNPKTRRQP